MGQRTDVKTKRWGSRGAVLGAGSRPRKWVLQALYRGCPAAGLKELGSLLTPHLGWVMALSSFLFFCLSPARPYGEAAETMGSGAHQGANPHSALDWSGDLGHVI